MRRLSSFAATAALVLALGGPANAQQLPLVITDVDLRGTQLAGGVLTAANGTVSGTLAGRPFKTRITDFALDLAPDGPATCAVLNLSLAPINLKLLGLHVDTSPICLDITAIPDGGLLGDLLCGLAGLDLDGVVGGLLGASPALEGESLLGTILGDALGDALDNALRQEPGQGGGRGRGPGGNGPPGQGGGGPPGGTPPGQGGGGPPGQGGGGSDDSVCTGDCVVLDLALGPVDLTLLGLNVVLDDCAGGPVQVCVSATAREGLLGSLLCSLTGGQLLGLDLGDIAQLIDLAQDLLEDKVLSQADITQLRQLLLQLLGA